MPRFSIILPVLNARERLGLSLDSFRAQTLTDWEAIVVDDGSTDDTRHLVRDWEALDDRIRLVRTPEMGASAARNHAVLKAARGSIIAFCNPDDRFAPNKLEQVARVLENPQIDAVYGQIGFFRKRPGDTRARSQVPPGALKITDLLGECPIGSLSNLAVRSSAFRSSVGFDETMEHCADLEWLIRLIGAGAHVAGVPSVMLWQRVCDARMPTDQPGLTAGRARAVSTAQRFGVVPDAGTEAVHLRGLARAALRQGRNRTEALRLTLRGLSHSPRAFLSPSRQGLSVVAGAMGAVVLPRPIRQAIFCT